MKTNYCACIAIIAAVVGAYSCSSPNTTRTTTSSALAEIVTCPATTVATVAISQFAFQPGTKTISVNEIVEWTNDDPTAHTVTSGVPGSPDGKFDVENLVSNASVCIQFLAAGSYPYFCNIHPFMTGTVIVQ